MNVIKLIILMIWLQNANALFSKLEKLKNKLTKMYKSKFGKEKTWQFLGLDPSEYPGTNERYRQMNEAKWDEYYSCLNNQNRNLGEHNSVTPEAIQGFEGGFVKLECKVCLSPQERTKADSIEWDWAGVQSKSMEPVEYDEHILLAPEEKSLLIYNLQMEQTGQYMCHLGDSLTAPYYLTVVNGSLNMSVVHSSNSPEGPYPREVDRIVGYNLVLDTEWGAWSLCSKCNKIGRKHRLGYCVVVHQLYEQVDDVINLESNDDDNNNNNNMTTDLYKLTTKRLKREPLENTSISNEEVNFMKIFKFGIPCRSHILPPSIKEIPTVVNRLDEIMIGYCREPCPEERIFEVKDEAGHIIEKANNSAGIFSMMQGPPQVEPAVERRLQYEKKNYAVTLTCPGNLNSDAPILWQIGGKNVIPLLLAQETKGRIYISATDRINIRKAKISDSNLYSCWQHKNLAGTIRLIVEKNFHFGFNHHIMLFGMVAILGTFTYVFVRAFFGRKYAKIYNE